MPEIPELQSTAHVLLVEPSHFDFNPEAARSNGFMRESGLPLASIRARAFSEFEGLVAALAGAGVTVNRVPGDTPLQTSARTPDAVYPNNWFSTHASGELVLYPMAIATRRPERRPDIVELLQRRYSVGRTLDLTALEDEGAFLEGTGSLVLDRENRIAYAGLSPRAGLRAVETWSREMRYEVVPFPIGIYHTNVMLSVGSRTAVICPDAIEDPSARERVLKRLRETSKSIVAITLDQARRFCGNVLELRGRGGAPFWAMSTRAKGGFAPEQLVALARDGAIVSAPVPTIEEVGGGSVRCMIAEIFLEPRPS